MKLTGRSVEVGHSFEKSMRKFKKKIANSGLLTELREREFYTKPTTERKQKKAQAKRRWQRHLDSQSLPPKLF